MMKKINGSDRKIRAKVTIFQVLEQALSRLDRACELARRRARETGTIASVPMVPEIPLPDEEAWKKVSVELLTAPQLAMKIKKDRTEVSRRLAGNSILPVYYNGKTPLHHPSVVGELHLIQRKPTPATHRRGPHHTPLPSNPPPARYYLLEPITPKTPVLKLPAAHIKNPPVRCVIT